MPVCEVRTFHHVTFNVWITNCQIYGGITTLPLVCCSCQNRATAFLTSSLYNPMTLSYPLFFLLLHSRESMWEVILENVARLNMAPVGQGLCQSANACIFGFCVGRHYESLLFFLLQNENVAMCILTLPQIEWFLVHTRINKSIISIYKEIRLEKIVES